jgi:pseudouridine kinase
MIFDENRPVLVVGGANVDLEGRPAAPGTAGDSIPGTVYRSPGGVGRNIADNLAQLGVPTRLITALADDPDGRWLYDNTVRSGVDMSATAWIARGRTSTYLSILDTAGGLVAAINDMEILDRLGPPELPPELFASASLVVVDANLSPAALGHVMTTDTPVFVDPVSVAKAGKLLPHLAGIHLLKPNRAEASHLSGVEIQDDPTLREASSILLDRGLTQVVISLGPDGVFFADHSTSGMVSAPDTRTSSVTGAGDSLMAGLVWSHLFGLTLEESARVGARLATLTLEERSTVRTDLSSINLERLLAEADR